MVATSLLHPPDGFLGQIKSRTAVGRLPLSDADQHGMSENVLRGSHNGRPGAHQGNTAEEFIGGVGHKIGHGTDVFSRESESENGV